MQAPRHHYSYGQLNRDPHLSQDEGLVGPVFIRLHLDKLPMHLSVVPLLTAITWTSVCGHIVLCLWLCVSA